MGLRDPLELDEMVRQFINEENVDTPADMGEYSYDDILGITFRLVNSADYYEYDSQYHVWRDKTNDRDYMRQLVKTERSSPSSGRPAVRGCQCIGADSGNLLSCISDKACGRAGSEGRDRKTAACGSFCQCIYRRSLRRGQRGR